MNITLVSKFVESSGSLDVEGCLVLFPKYMLKLIELGKDIIVTGDKIGDRKACKILITSALNEENEEICDILVYNIENKSWIALNISDDCVVRVKRKGYDYYDYYPQFKYLDDCDFDYKVKLNALINYVRIYSSANLTIR